jgi:hypothetical protein
MATQNPPATKPKSVKRACLSGCVIVFALLLGILALAWTTIPIALPSLINSTSMRIRIDGYAKEPALPNGSYILADTLAYQQHLPQRGDLVVFQFDSPTSNSTVLLSDRP